MKTGLLWAHVSQKGLHLEPSEGLKWGATLIPGLTIRTGSVYPDESTLLTQHQLHCVLLRVGGAGAPWLT